MPIIIQHCLRCNKEFPEYDYRVLKEGKGKYCSKECRYPPIIHKCLFCEKEFRPNPSLVKRTGAKYCSKKCSDKGRKGKSIGKLTGTFRNCLFCGKEIYSTPFHDKRNRKKYCSKDCMYKSLTKENAGKGAIHGWIYRRLGKPQFCEGCGSEDKKIYAWANISQEYKRDLDDWLRLCYKCHNNMDDIAKKAWITKKKGKI